MMKSNAGNVSPGNLLPGSRLPNTKKAVLEFTEMMQILTESGLSLRDALEVLVTTDRRSNGRAPAVLGNRISEIIRRGASFAGAIQTMDDVFPQIYRGMIKVGDKVGSVERIFSRLRNYLKEQKTLGDKISAALIYPVMVLSLSMAGVLALVFFVMPKLETIFGGFGGDSAERIRQNIHAIELLLSCFAGIVFTLILSTVVLFCLGKHRSEFGRFLDYRLLKIPLLGTFLSTKESLNFSFAMEVLSSGGLPIESALEEAAQVVSNRAYRHSLFMVRDRVINGGNLSAAFASDKIFPPYMGRWIAIGEKSGRTETVFSQIRSYFQEEIEQQTAKFLLLIEPALITLIGVVLMGLIAGIVLPLFSIYANVL
jgi:type II secretory pathway component PulF